MKIFTMFSLLALSANLFAAEHSCTYQNFDIHILTERDNDVHLIVSKNEHRVMSCNMKVTGFDDGKTGASLSELVSFEKIGCDVVDANLASGVAIIDKGFIKTSPDHRTSSANVIENEQPLMCELKPTVQSKEFGIKGAAAEPNYSVQRVHFATDRAASGSRKLADYFGAEQSDKLSYGVCEVSIPRDHRMGELESPSALRFEFKPDPTKHIILTKIETQETALFFNELKQRLRASKSKKAFVFIHGFNVSFEEAARRTAQINYDLGFSGAPIFYSWPSQAKLTRYSEDEVNAEWSQLHLKNFFASLATKLETEEIFVIAHSMGNRPTTQALSALFKERPELAARFKEIILVAPDINAKVFKDEIAPQLLSAGRRVTLYASSNDAALKLSKAVHGGQRLGDASPNIVVLPGMDSIDASNVKTDLIGHSYYADARSVLSDLFDVVRGPAPAAVRGRLEEVSNSFGRFWRFKPASQ